MCDQIGYNYNSFICIRDNCYNSFLQIINSENANLKECLYFAYTQENIRFVDILLNRFDIDVTLVQNSVQQTLLHILCSKPKINIYLLKILIDRGIDVNARDIEGETALFYIFSNRNFNKNIENVFNILIENGADLNIKNKNNESLLLISCFRGNTDFISLLIKSGLVDENIIKETREKVIGNSDYDIILILDSYQEYMFDEVKYPDVE